MAQLRQDYDEFLKRDAEVVVVGRSNIVGKPIANMMLQKGPGANSTLTIVHTRTKDLADHCCFYRIDSYTCWITWTFRVQNIAV